jgi:hypothetical protein
MSPSRFDRVLSLLQGENTYNLRTVAGRRQKAMDEVALLTIDEACKAHTAFDTFKELIETRLTSGYRPSLYTTSRGRSYHDFRRAFLTLKIADAYDAAMIALNDSRRAFRGS